MIRLPQKVLRIVEYCLVAAIILLSQLKAHPNNTEWQVFFLICPVACLLYEIALKRDNQLLSRLMAGALICFLLFECRQDITVGRISIPVSSLFFVLLCVCHLLRQGLDFGPELRRLPAFLSVVSMAIILPLAVSGVLVSSRYQGSPGLAFGLLVKSIEICVVMVILFCLMRGKLPHIVLLSLVCAKCAMGVFR
ncbi:hypothetical protein ACFLQR_00215 [Verrucomicrobiota bacterium]